MAMDGAASKLLWAAAGCAVGVLASRLLAASSRSSSVGGGSGGKARREPRFVGGVIGVRKEKLARYKELFSHFEYVGDDFEADMAAIGDDPVTKDWWRECEPCQEPLQWHGAPPSEGGAGERVGDAWWAGMERVFHCGAHATDFATPPN